MPGSPLFCPFSKITFTITFKITESLLIITAYIAFLSLMKQVLRGKSAKPRAKQCISLILHTTIVLMFRPIQISHGVIDIFMKK